jgi:transglutaminase/protease-like cytokinesis protein 3
VTACDILRPDPVKLGESVIETVEELDAVIAQISDNFESSAEVLIRSIHIWNDLSDYYDEHPGIFAMRGIRGTRISYVQRNGYIEAEIFPDYEMFMKLIIAHETRDTSQLNEQELEVLDKAWWIIENFVSAPHPIFDQAHSIHRYLTDTITYDENHAENKNAFNVYGALIEGLAVCQGYAQSYKLLLHLIDIESIIVTGVAGGEKHAWNLVNYDGEWYHVDVTWNVTRSDDSLTGVSNRFFNLCDEILSDTHTWNTSLGLYPKADSSWYNYFWHLNVVAETLQELQEKFAAYFPHSEGMFEIICRFEVTPDELAFLHNYTEEELISYSVIPYGENALLLTVLL